MPTVSRLALQWRKSLLSSFFLRDLQAAFWESVARTCRRGLLGQASPALLFHTIALESRDFHSGPTVFQRSSVPKGRGHQGAVSESKATAFVDVLTLARAPL